MKTNIPTIITPRLTLRPFTEDDIDPMYQIMIGKDVLRYFPRTDPPERDRVEKMVLGLLKHWKEYGYGLWAVESRSNGDLMGRCGLQYLPDTDEVEVDFILGREFWGQGFATEAGRTSVRHGFDELGVKSIVGIVHVDNGASQRALEKLGLTRKKRAEYFGMDCYQYSIDRTAYEAASQTWM
ncbi:MAG: GNAT family N-acetyltransferase [Chloroflexi bacterium]|nr:GNAT family N-acetyltransferase [Chloroflexota bacterium]